MTVAARAIRSVHHLAATAAGAGLVLAGCTSGEPADAVGSGAPEPVVDVAPAPEPSEPKVRVALADSGLDADLERFCRAHESALRAVDATIADDAGKDDAGEDDAVAVLIGSLETVTSTLAANLRADGGSLHSRVEPLVAAAEQTAADAREALDEDHDARHDYIADQLAGVSYLQPLVDDPALYATVAGIAACEGLPLGAVAAELRDREDEQR